MKQNQYLYMRDEDDEYWLELDEKNNVIRQITKDSNDNFHLSCFEDCLAEIPIADTSAYKTISCDAFKKVWNRSVSVHNSEWIKIKNKYALGSFIDLKVECFYPQGIIMKGRDFKAVYIGENNYELHENVNLQVMQYDEDNHWVVVL